MMLNLLEKPLPPKIKQKVEKDSLNFSQVTSESLEDDNKLFRELPPILLPYQQKFVKICYNSPVVVVEKSRRIGITHALACFAVLEASKRLRGTNFFYIGTTKDLGRDFISSCEYWAKAFNIAGYTVSEVMIKDEDKDILAFRINFSNGKRVEALSSKPASIRGRQGHIALDEYAFYKESQEEFLKASLALQIWGGKLFVISTHNGVNNEFNKLINQVISGEKPYLHQKITFREAVDDGLYERICLMKGEEYDVENCRKWLEDIYQKHGENASEELDCIPREESSNSLFKRKSFKIIDEIPEYLDYVVWGWDFAATDKDSSCYTVGVKLGKLGDEFFILDWKFCKLNPNETQKFVIEVCKNSEKDVPIFLELEGGSQSILWLENSFKPLLNGYIVKGCRPEGSKMIRAIPIAEKVSSGNVFIKNSHWTENFLSNITTFEGKPGVPLVTDTGDALSLAFAEVNKGITGFINSGTVVKPKKSLLSSNRNKFYR